MAGFADFLKTISVPFIISLAGYLLATHVLLPFYRNHWQRYAPYIPVPQTLSSTTSASLHTLSARTSSLRNRLGGALIAFFAPWSARRAALDADDDYEIRVQRFRCGPRDEEEGADDDSFDDDDEDVEFAAGEGDLQVLEVWEGEEGRRRRREALDEQRRRGRGEIWGERRRLSRELEEGFRDSSDEEEDEDEVENSGR